MPANFGIGTLAARDLQRLRRLRRFAPRRTQCSGDEGIHVAHDRHEESQERRDGGDDDEMAARR